MSRKNILLIEHDPATAEFLQYALTDEGYDVTIVDQCMNAAMGCQKSNPALIVLDICPLAICCKTFFSQCIQSTCMNTPLIILTASPHPEDIQRKLHPQELISKPFDLDILLAQIHKYMDIDSAL